MPNPPGQTVRSPETGFTTFREADAPTEIPDFPGEYDPGPLALEYWAAIWSSPFAAAILPVDRMAVARICRMHAEDVRGQLSVTGKGELRMLEQSFGISLGARRSLRYEIERAGGSVEANQPVDGARKRRQDVRGTLSVHK
jgi:hypothetical protein